MELLIGVVVGSVLGWVGSWLVMRHEEMYAIQQAMADRLTNHYAALVAGARTMYGVTGSDWSPMREWESASLVEAESALAYLELEDQEVVGSIIELYVEMRSAFNGVLLARTIIKNASPEEDVSSINEKLSKREQKVTEKRSSLLGLCKHQIEALRQPIEVTGIRRYWQLLTFGPHSIPTEVPENGKA